MTSNRGSGEPAPSREEHRARPRREADRRLLQRDRELEAARRISEALFQHLSQDELVARALQTALGVVDAESGSILLADSESERLVFRHSIGASPVQPGTAIPWESGIAGAVYRSGEPIVLADVRQDRRHCREIDQQTRHETRDMIALPLKRWEGEPIGVLEVLNKRHGTLDEDDVALLSVVCAITASSIEQTRLHHEAKLAEVARLLGDIGHDIKNLLMPVFTGAGLLEEELGALFSQLPDKDKAKAQAGYEMCRDMIEMFSASTRRIQDRVKAIADCVKGLSTEPNFAPCAIEAVVKAVFEALSWQAEHKGLVLRSDGLEALPRIEADEWRLFNAFYNLINNAIPEVAEGGSITVSGRIEPADAEVLVAVADTGRGIPPDIRDTLFTAHARSRKAGGTGLGTKIVKDVVEAHHGRITVQSEVGAGTTITLRLPVTQPAVASLRCDADPASIHDGIIPGAH